MDSPFYRGNWNVPSRPRYYSPPASREIPVRRQSTASPKVVSIPVRFVAPERSRSDSAVKIQKVFRGFLVRKGVKKVAALRREVDEIEKRISNREVVDLIRRPESKERVKLIEGLMNLLFRLDSVRGVDSGVRDFRKATIKKAIALQESIDAIVAGDESKSKDEEAPEVIDSASNFSRNCDSDELHNQIDETMPDSVVEAVSPDLIKVESIEEKEGEIAGSVEFESPDLGQYESIGEKDAETAGKSQIDDSMPESVESMPPDLGQYEPIGEKDAETAGKSQIDDSMPESIESMPPDFGQYEPIGEIAEKYEVLEESVGTNRADSAPDSIKDAMEEHGEPEQQQRGGDRVSEKAGNGREREDVLQRMMEDNRRMMGLMEGLVEKNEKQTRLLNSLSQRVELLERAFVCEKLRKNKKKRHTC